MESHKRSIAKALSWRLIATVVTMAVAWVFTGTLDTALKIGILDTIIKLAAYYYHERVWIKLPFGKHPQPEYQI